MKPGEVTDWHYDGPLVEILPDSEFGLFVGHNGISQFWGERIYAHGPVVKKVIEAKAGEISLSNIFETDPDGRNGFYQVPQGVTIEFDRTPLPGRRPVHGPATLREVQPQA